MSSLFSVPLSISHHISADDAWFFFTYVVVVQQHSPLGFFSLFISTSVFCPGKRAALMNSSGFHRTACGPSSCSPEHSSPLNPLFAPRSIFKTTQWCLYSTSPRMHACAHTHTPQGSVRYDQHLSFDVGNQPGSAPGGLPKREDNFIYVKRWINTAYIIELQECVHARLCLSVMSS